MRRCVTDGPFGRRLKKADVQGEARAHGGKEARRNGAGDDAVLLPGLNVDFKTESHLQVARGLDALGLCWFESGAWSHWRRDS